MKNLELLPTESIKPMSPSRAGFNGAIDRIAGLHSRRVRSRKHVAQIVESMRTEIWRMVLEKGRFMWPGFGVFYLGRSKERRVRLPMGPAADGSTHVTVPESWKLKFRASKKTKGVGHGPAAL
jgi:nucleoid DNA-binding protein